MAAPIVCDLDCVLLLILRIVVMSLSESPTQPVIKDEQNPQTAPTANGASWGSRSDFDPARGRGSSGFDSMDSNALWPRATVFQSQGGWQKLSLRTKATIAAIAIGTLPLVAIGTIAYQIADFEITQDILQSKEVRAVGLADKVNRYMFDRLADIRTMADQPYFANAALRATKTAPEKSALLNQIQAAYVGTYTSIAVFDLEGNVIAQTSGKKLDNHLNRPYIQDALKANAAVFGQPSISASSGIYSLYTAAPIKDQATGKTIGVIRARIPVAALNEVIKNFSANDDHYYLVNADKDIFLGSKGEYSTKMTSAGKVMKGGKDEYSEVKMQSVIPNFDKIAGTKGFATTVGMNKETNTEQVLAFAKISNLAGMPALGWETVITTDTQVAFAPQRQLLIALSLGTLATAVLVSAIAAYLAYRATRPIIAASSAVQEIGQGNLEVRIPVTGVDELAILGSNINQMAEQIQDLIISQEEAAQQQFAAQVEVSQQQMESAKRELAAKEFLQNRALELLMEVGPLRQGDLTIRANVTEDEIGTIADSYNATIGSLRKIVTQVQQAAQQVSETADDSEVSVQALTTDAQQQSTAMQVALDQIEQMSESIQLVANNAQSAEQAMQLANQTVGEGDAAMNRTVEGFMTIRETVADTAKKVKQLGESSQKISKVVSLIGNFASQTNLLALNASIEAAHAGEEGRGFAVVADEVRSLARQSARATAEIEQLVASIQTETNEVVTAMEAGTQQVVAGTQLVEETRQSLAKVRKASDQITALVQAIAQAAVSQTQASSQVSATITDVAGIADNTSVRATQVLGSFQDLLKVAQDLQTTVSQFKLS
jgi:methyl-accepting chemotaxis protein PixJ